MKKNKVFVACDTTNIKKIKTIIEETKNNKIKVGYKFGLEFLNSKMVENLYQNLKIKFFLEIIRFQIYLIHA